MTFLHSLQFKKQKEDGLRLIGPATALSWANDSLFLVVVLTIESRDFSHAGPVLKKNPVQTNHYTRYTNVPANSFLFCCWSIITGKELHIQKIFLQCITCFWVRRLQCLTIKKYTIRKLCVYHMETLSKCNERDQSQYPWIFASARGLNFLPTELVWLVVEPRFLMPAFPFPLSTTLSSSECKISSMLSHFWTDDFLKINPGISTMILKSRVTNIILYLYQYM